MRERSESRDNQHSKHNRSTPSTHGSATTHEKPCLQNQEHEEICVGHTAELLKEVAREKRENVVLRGDNMVVLCGT